MLERFETVKKADLVERLELFEMLELFEKLERLETCFQARRSGEKKGGKKEWVATESVLKHIYSL